MKKLAVIFVSLCFMLLIGAMFGVQYMNEELGISQPEPLTVEEKSPGKVKIQMQTLELKEKKVRVEEVGQFNFFSELGRTLGDGVNMVSRTFLSEVMSFVHEVLNRGNGEV